MTEVHEDLCGLSPDIMKIIFKLGQDTDNMKHFQISKSQHFRTKAFGLGSTACRANLTSCFQIRIKVPLTFHPCSCCKKYINHLGYM